MEFKFGHNFYLLVIRGKPYIGKRMPEKMSEVLVIVVRARSGNAGRRCGSVVEVEVVGSAAKERRFRG